MKKTYWLTFVSMVSISPLMALESLPHTKEVKGQFSTTATELTLLVEQGISELEGTPKEQWAFQISRYENEEGNVTSSIERFSPTGVPGMGWSLLHINGETPSAKQSENYQAEKLKRASKNRDDGTVIKLRELIQLDSLVLQSENPQMFKASFRVQLERLGDDASEKLAGVLTFNKQEQFIHTIDIVNREPFSPLFGAKITDLKMTFSFNKIDDAILPVQKNLIMKGRFAFVTEIDEVSSDVYSDYRFVGNAKEKPQLLSQ